MENRKTILAIDDNRDILYTLEQICRFQDWVPLLAAGYEEAERFIKNERIDLILVDYHMPGVDGITAVKKIRKKLPKTPIIVLTIEEKEQIVSRFMDAGADDYSLKPVSYTHLDVYKRQWTEMSWAVTRASPTTPWASARAWGSPWVTRCS